LFDLLPDENNCLVHSVGRTKPMDLRILVNSSPRSPEVQPPPRKLQVPAHGASLDRTSQVIGEPGPDRGEVDHRLTSRRYPEPGVPRRITSIDGSHSRGIDAGRTREPLEGQVSSAEPIYLNSVPQSHYALEQPFTARPPGKWSCTLLSPVSVNLADTAVPTFPHMQQCGLDLKE